MNIPEWLSDDVSRETFADLSAYAALVQKWSQRINLVSKQDLDRLWDRHIWDSAQVWMIAPKSGSWLDLGTGGGFPAVVAAILAKSEREGPEFRFVESDQRKCVFLSTVIRQLDLRASVLNARIEKIDVPPADVISARALGDLSLLLRYAQPFCHRTSVCVFPKGSKWQEEIARARQDWDFSCVAHASKTNSDASILEISDVRPK